MSEIVNCRDCIYWEPWGEPYGTGSHGDCRRRAPLPILVVGGARDGEEAKMAVWPVTGPSDRCAEGEGQ